jgi:hypothetical protein
MVKIMKLKFTLILLAAIVVGFVSCKKNDSALPLGGKWQETKLRLYELDSSNRILHDTTFLAPFTNLDYVQFNADGTITTSSDHYYYPNDSGYLISSQAIPQSIGTLNYTSAGPNTYVLSSTSTLNSPGEFYVTDTAFVTGNTLRIHVINYGHSSVGYKNITDSYYQQ